VGVPSVTILPIRPWPDGVIDALGEDPRSAYVERFWLGILGPQTPAHEQQRRRSRRLALSLLELGEDVEATEQQLARWRFHPSVCREAAAWAAERHQRSFDQTDADPAA